MLLVLPELLLRLRARRHRQAASRPLYLRGARGNKVSEWRQMRSGARRAARCGMAAAPHLYSCILVKSANLPAERAQGRCQQWRDCSMSITYRFDQREARNAAGAAAGGHG